MELVLGSLPCVRLESATTQNLLLQLGPYQYTVNTHYGEATCSMWPLVKHIKFGLDCELLKQNMCLVDLPGLTDANSMRVQNAHDHMRACTHELIVADIARAADDNFIRERCKESRDLRGPERTMICCTHGDDMDENTEYTGSPKNEDILERLAKEAEQLERKVNEISSRIKKGGPDKLQWKSARKEAQKDLEEKEFLMLKKKLEMRTKDTIEELQDFYSKLTQDPVQLPVFCVGNKAYFKHQAGYKKTRPPPILSVEETQIPKLRRHLFLAPAEGRLNETRHLVFTQLPVAIKSAKLFVSKTHLDRKDEIGDLVKYPQTMVNAVVDKALEHLKERAEELLLEPYRRADSEWSAQALKLCRGWARMHGPTFHLTYLKKYGSKRGKGKGAALDSWNNELIDIQVDAIRQWFGDFLPSLQEAAKEIYRTTLALTSQMTGKIRGMNARTRLSFRSDVKHADDMQSTSSSR